MSVDGLPYVSDNASIYNSTRVYGPGRNRELLLCKYYILTRDCAMGAIARCFYAKPEISDFLGVGGFVSMGGFARFYGRLSICESFK